MSEKRFKVIDDNFSMWIVDTTLKEDKHEGAIYTAYDMCRKLNELYEENEKLKRENEALRSNVELFAHQLEDHTLYSDDFLEILKIIEGEETIEKIRERQNEIIKILGCKYE